MIDMVLSMIWMPNDEVSRSSTGAEIDCIG